MSDELEALVVGGVDFNESDRIVRLLTRTGRMSAFAPGARKSRKRFGGAIEPFTTILGQMDTRRKRGMPVLSSATATRTRLELTSDFAKIALGSYVCELAAAVAPEEDPSDGIYELATITLDRLLERPATAALQRAFEGHLIVTLGMAPSLERCAVCGDEVAPIAKLDLKAGGVLCERDGGGAYTVGPKTRQWLAAVLGGTTLDETGGVDDEWADTAARKLAGPMAAFFAHLIPFRLRSADLLVEALG